VERSRSAAATARLNLDTTGFANIGRVETRDVSTFLAAPPAEAPFDLVLCDPPYGAHDDALATALEALASGAWLGPDAFVVVERARRDVTELVPPTGLRVTWDRRFGDTLVAFLQP
jgi:16S rRNA (guanine966-N2)-methyltransferase